MTGASLWILPINSGARLQPTKSSVVDKRADAEPEDRTSEGRRAWPTLADRSYSKMKVKLTQLTGSIVAPKGFSASGVFCDIKKIGTGKGSEKGNKRDLALIVSQVPATVAGMFTTNQICAAPVKVCLQRA